jgi:hypothetical protein
MVFFVRVFLIQLNVHIRSTVITRTVDGGMGGWRDGWMAGWVGGVLGMGGWVGGEMDIRGE